MEDPKRKKDLMTRLQYRYRLAIVNDNTFEEHLSLNLTPLKVFVFIGTVSILMISLVTSLIAFTPLREYIPGYADVGVTRNLIHITEKSDSLQQVLLLQDEYMKNISGILRGEIEEVDRDENNAEKDDDRYKNLTMQPSEKETEHRKLIEDTQDQYSLAVEKKENIGGVSSFFFFTPVKGVVSHSFNTREKHFGVDIVAAENAPINATMDGTVILSTWSSETGHTIAIQHNNHIISVYKHNSVLLKKSGAIVKAGEPIAIIGNSGEQTSGPHLHFELWYNGNAIDPQDYVSL